MPQTPASAQAPSPLLIAQPSSITTTVADAESRKAQDILHTSPLWMQTNPNIMVQLRVDNVEIHLPDQTQVANLLRDGLKVRRGTSTLTAADQIQSGDIVEINDTAKLAISLRNIDHTPAAAQLDYMGQPIVGGGSMGLRSGDRKPIYSEKTRLKCSQIAFATEEASMARAASRRRGEHAFAADPSIKITDRVVGQTRPWLIQIFMTWAWLEWSSVELSTHWGSYLATCGESTRSFVKRMLDSLCGRNCLHTQMRTNGLRMGYRNTMRSHGSYGGPLRTIAVGRLAYMGICLLNLPGVSAVENGL